MMMTENCIDIPSLFGEEVRMPKTGEKRNIREILNGKSRVLLYFSASWCPPCRALTPKLAEAYADCGDKPAMFFVSLDRDEANFREYHDKMTFPAVSYKVAGEKKWMNEIDVQGIPTLVVLSKEGKIIEANASRLYAKYLPSAN